MDSMKTFSMLMMRLDRRVDFHLGIRYTGVDGRYERNVM